MKYSVAKDFSLIPAGRTAADGKYYGGLLRQALRLVTQKYGPTEVDLDGTLGYGSDFLEEAFSGLIELPLTIISRDSSLVMEVDSYMRRKPPQKDLPRHIEEAYVHLQEADTLKSGGVTHTACLHKALAEVVTYLAKKEGVVPAPTVFTPKGPTIKQLQDLWRVCCQWRDVHQPSCPEALYQVDSINAVTPELVEKALDIVGYWKGEEDG